MERKAYLQDGLATPVVIIGYDQDVGNGSSPRGGWALVKYFDGYEAKLPVCMVKES